MESSGSSLPLDRILLQMELSVPVGMLAGVRSKVAAGRWAHRRVRAVPGSRTAQGELVLSVHSNDILPVLLAKSLLISTSP